MEANCMYKNTTFYGRRSLRISRVSWWISVSRACFDGMAKPWHVISSGKAVECYAEFPKLRRASDSLFSVVHLRSWLCSIARLASLCSRALTLKAVKPKHSRLILVFIEYPRTSSKYFVRCCANVARNWMEANRIEETFVSISLVCKSVIYIFVIKWN